MHLLLLPFVAFLSTRGLARWACYSALTLAVWACVVGTPAAASGPVIAWGQGASPSITGTAIKAGKERLSAKLAKGPALARADFGDPTVANGTAVALCLYDDAGTLVEPLEMDRAGASCGPRPCWKPIGKRSPDGEGFAYRDPAGSTYGVRSMQLQGGAAGRASLSLAASNNVKRDRTAPLPAGIAAALSTTAEVTLQVHTSDAGCFGATLTDITKQKSDQFKAR